MPIVTIPARRLAAHDDCLAAAVRLVERRLPDVAGWDLSPRWDDEGEREAVLVDVPDFAIEDRAEQLGVEAAEHGDQVTAALCALATAGDIEDVDLSDADHSALERLGIVAVSIEAAGQARAHLARQLVLG